MPGIRLQPGNWEQLEDVISGATSAYKPAGPALQNLDIRGLNTATTAMADGTLQLTTIDLPASFVVSTIYWVSGTTALVNGGAPHYWVALFDASRNLLRQSTDSVAKAVAASTVISDSLSSSFTTTYGGQYYVGIMVTSNGGTQPTMSTFTSLVGITNLTSGMGGGKFNGTSSTGQGASAPNPAAAITQTAPIPWVGVS